jgi:hypothetical protein
MSHNIQPYSVAQGSVLRRAWNRVFGPRFLPDAPPQSEDKTRAEAEAMMRLADEGPIADDTIKAIDKLPENRKDRSSTKTSGKA